jgi:ATP-dependent Clp protease ATP-binding subunit ClpA
MQIGERNYSLSSKILTNATVFDRAVSVADELADLTRGQEDEQPRAFEAILARQIRAEIHAEAVDSFYKVYRALKIVKESGKDTIWKFIVQNL